MCVWRGFPKSFIRVKTNFFFRVYFSHFLTKLIQMLFWLVCLVGWLCRVFFFLNQIFWQTNNHTEFKKLLRNECFGNSFNVHWCTKQQQQQRQRQQQWFYAWSFIWEKLNWIELKFKFSITLLLLLLAEHLRKKNFFFFLDSFIIEWWLSLMLYYYHCDKYWPAAYTHQSTNVQSLDLLHSYKKIFFFFC